MVVVPVLPGLLPRLVAWRPVSTCCRAAWACCRSNCSCIWSCWSWEAEGPDEFICPPAARRTPDSWDNNSAGDRTNTGFTVGCFYISQVFCRQHCRYQQEEEDGGETNKIGVPLEMVVIGFEHTVLEIIKDKLLYIMITQSLLLVCVYWQKKVQCKHLKIQIIKLFWSSNSWVTTHEMMCKDSLFKKHETYSVKYRYMKEN